MAVPYSATFSTADWNSRYALTSDASDASITDATSGLIANADMTLGVTNTAAGVRVRSNGATAIASSTVLSTLRWDTTLSENYSVEFDVTPTGDLPADFSDPNNRVYVGATKASGFSSGILFSKQGLALAPDPLAPQVVVKPLAGTAILLDGSTLTIRIVTDADINKQFVYVTKSSVAYEVADSDGAHDLLFTVTPLEATLSIDCVLLATRATGGAARDYSIEVSSVRIGAGTATPASLPVAVVKQTGPALVGRKVLLDGSGSYDPAGTALSYSWALMG